MRRARKKMGPGSVSLMPIAARPIRGAVSTSATAAQQTSKRRFAMMQRTTHGHEGFGGLEALLIAPSVRAVAQRLEGARMGIGSELARVAGHRGELDVEGRGDVHPRVGGECAR